MQEASNFIQIRNQILPSSPNITIKRHTVPIANMRLSLSCMLYRRPCTPTPRPRCPWSAATPPSRAWTCAASASATAVKSRRSRRSSRRACVRAVSSSCTRRACRSGSRARTSSRVSCASSSTTWPRKLNHSARSVHSFLIQYFVLSVAKKNLKVLSSLSCNFCKELFLLLSN